jgi:hypothetical protein
VFVGHLLGQSAVTPLVPREGEAELEQGRPGTSHLQGALKVLGQPFVHAIEHGDGERFLGREVPEQCPHSHAGPPGDLLDRGAKAKLCEHFFRRGQHSRSVAHCVRPRNPLNLAHH